jgi:hypothetical protein
MITSMRTFALFLQEQAPMNIQTFAFYSAVVGALGCGGLCGIISGCPAFLLGYLCCGWCCCCYIIPCSGALGGGVLGGLWGILNAAIGGCVGGLVALGSSLVCFWSPWIMSICGSAGAYLPQICPVS